MGWGVAWIPKDINGLLPLGTMGPFQPFTEGQEIFVLWGWALLCPYTEGHLCTVSCILYLHYRNLNPFPVSVSISSNHIYTPDILPQNTLLKYLFSKSMMATFPNQTTINISWLYCHSSHFITLYVTYKESYLCLIYKI